MPNKNRKAVKTAAEQMIEERAQEELKDAPKSWRDALANVLVEVPKSALKMVNDATEFITKVARTAAHNTFGIGEQLLKVQKGVSEATFNRLMAEVWTRCTGLTSGTLKRYMRHFEVLSDAVKAEAARDAFLVVNGSKALFSTTDGITTLTGAYVAALRKHAVPSDAASYDECLDWAREVLVFAEKAEGNRAPNAGELYKRVVNTFRRILEGGRGMAGNQKIALGVIVALYSAIRTKNEALAQSVYVSFEALENGRALDDATNEGWTAMQAASKAGATKEKVAA